MNTKIQNKRPLLAGLALSLAAAFTMPVLAHPGGGPGGYGGMHGGGMYGGGMHGGPMHGGGMHGGPGMMQGGGMWQARERVNVTPEQRAQIQKILQTSRDEMLARHEAGRALREQSMALFAQPTVDANALEALRQQRLAMHDAATKRRDATMLEISRVLTPEQRKQVGAYMTQRQEMMQRHQHERRRLDAPPKS